MKRFLFALLLPLLLACTDAPAVNTAYTTACTGNSNCTNAGHIGNAPRSMLVDSNGTVTTSSNWDENEGSVAIYQNGALTGSLLAHGGGSGSAITGNATYLWVPCEFNAHAPAGEQNGCVQRVLRAAPNTVDVVYGVSTNTTERYADLITGLATWGTTYWAAYDNAGQRVRVYDESNNPVYTWPAANGGALTFDRNRNIWVAGANVLTQYAWDTGTVLQTVTLPSTSVITALYYDATTQDLLVGDSGPDLQVKTFNLQGQQLSTFGDLGGYLNTVTGIAGAVGPTRFTRIDGIGKDSAGNLYVLNERRGHNFDLGRDGGGNVSVFSPSGTLLWAVEGDNFEAVGDADLTDGNFYSGTDIYSASTQGKLLANTVDFVHYPTDARLQTNMSIYQGRGTQFGMVREVTGGKLLIATDQNPDTMFFYHILPGSYIAIPDGSLPGSLPFNETAGRIRHGFAIDARGDVWASYDRCPSTCTSIFHYPFTGFVNGAPTWGPAVVYPVPAQVLAAGGLGRLDYIAATDTLVMGTYNGTDWTSLGPQVFVFPSWTTNQTNPVVINLNESQNPKTMSADGNYLFVGYVHTVPNIDAFNLGTGSLDNTFTTSNGTYVGNDVDSMYGLRCHYDGVSTYTCAKDDYNGNSSIVYTWKP